jgi:hypothetical protein
VPPPLFTSDKREASLAGGNCRIQKCDSVDPLSLVIKCLRRGGYESGDLVVLIIDKQPSPSGGQVNTHTHTQEEKTVDLIELCQFFVEVCFEIHRAGETSDVLVSELFTMVSELKRAFQEAWWIMVTFFF